MNLPPPEEIYRRLIKAGEDYADKDGAAALLEELRKPLLAQLTIDAEGRSMAEREAIALASDAYEIHVEKMVAARREAIKARARLDAARVWVDMMRSAESSRRAEMQMR